MATSDAQVAALNQLTDAVLGVTGLLESRLAEALRRDTRPASSGGGLGSATVTGLMALLGKLAAALAPLALLGTILGSATSGMSVFLSAVKVLGSVLGTLLLPVFAVLAAGVIAVADYLWQQLLPSLEGWYKFVVEGGRTAVEVLTATWYTVRDIAVQVFTGMRDTAQQLYAEVAAVFTALRDIRDNPMEFVAGGVLGLGAGAARAAGESVGGPGGAALADPFEGLGEVSDTFQKYLRQAQTNNAGPGGGAPERFDRALTEVLQEMRHGMGPRAQSMGIAEASRQAQMAALNQSPFERKMLDHTARSLELLERVAANTRPKGAE